MHAATEALSVAPHSTAFLSGRAVVFSAPCEGHEVNEDAALLVPIDEQRGVLAVADGMGGQPAGHRASQLALDVLRDSVLRAGQEGDYLREAILDGVERANKAVMDLRLGAGTTLAVVELRGAMARAYHVGDSEVLIVGQRGRLRLQTVAHNPVAYGVHAGLLDEREAMDHEDRHLLSNVVGSTEMRIEIGPLMRLRPRDTVLLATDGLLDNLHGDEILETIRTRSLERRAEELATKAKARMATSVPGEPGKPDDLTFILYRPTG